MLSECQSVFAFGKCSCEFRNKSIEFVIYSYTLHFRRKHVIKNYCSPINNGILYLDFYGPVFDLHIVQFPLAAMYTHAKRVMRGPRVRNRYGNLIKIPAAIHDTRNNDESTRNLKKTHETHISCRSSYECMPE